MSGKLHEATSAQDNESSQSLAPATGTAQASVPDAAIPLVPFDDYKKDTEFRYFKALMQTTGADIHKACELSQLGKQSLYRYLRIHGISTRT